MREMKDSGVAWIGKIPTKWTIAKAKNCVEIQNGNDPKTEGSIPVYGSGSMSFKTCGEYKEGPSVLIGRKGATLHIPHYISSKFWNVDTAFNVYSKSIFDLKYYFYCAHVFDYKLYMSQTTLPSMTQTAYENMFLPLPTKEEQCAIANQLDQVCAEIDAVLEKTRASIEEYKKLKQAVITQAVTKGIRGDRPMKDSGIEWIGAIQKDWGSNTIAQLCSQVKCKNTGLQEKNLLSLSYGKVKRKSIDTVEGLLPESFDGYNIIEKDDIVLRLTDLQNDHTSLRVGLAEERGIITSAYLTIRNRSNMCTKYLYYYLHSFDIAKGFYGMGAGVRQGLNWDGVKWLKVLVPSVSEQEHIVAFLDAESEKLDALIAKKQQYLSEIENYKKSLIYEYVTGKKEVHPL